MSVPADSDSLYEDAACGLLVTDADGTILRANRTFVAWLGRAATELVGCRFQSLLTMGGRIFHQTHWAPLLKMQGSVGEVKLDMRHADGRKLAMVMNAVVRRRDGVEFHELAIFSARDRHRYEDELLKSRARAEAHLASERQSRAQLAEARALLDLAVGAAQLFQWSVELPSRLCRYAPEVAVLLGFPAARAIEAVEFSRHIHGDDRHAFHSALDAFLDEGQGRLHIVFRILGADGAERWIAAWGCFREGEGGAPIDLVGVLQDVTESQRQRALAEDRALLAEQTLGIVGHDLRNPLAAIQMGAEILSLRHLDEEQQRALGARVMSSTRRAIRLIADLLDFTQVRTGRRLSVAAAAVDGHVIARDVVAELATVHPGRLLRHVPQGDARLVADGDRIAQALSNLISNALSYGSPESPVTVRSSGLPERVRFSVHNDGPAIDPALRATIFEPMTRGEARGQLRSVGLGLFIVREIATAHGGDVEFVSDEAQGTTFVFELPRAAAIHQPFVRDRESS